MSLNLGLINLKTNLPQTAAVSRSFRSRIFSRTKKPYFRAHQLRAIGTFFASRYRFGAKRARTSRGETSGRTARRLRPTFQGNRRKELRTLFRMWIAAIHASMATLTVSSPTNAIADDCTYASKETHPKMANTSRDLHQDVDSSMWNALFARRERPVTAPRGWITVSQPFTDIRKVKHN